MSPTATPESEAPWGTHAPTGWRRCWLRRLHAIPAGAGWRRLALWLRRPLKKAFGDDVDIEVWGLKLRVRSRGNLSEQRLLLMPQFLDTTERDTLADFLRDGGVFFDIGANAGIYSLWVGSLRLPGVRVEAFEPSPALCARLGANLVRNQLDNIRLNPCALGRTTGIATLVAGDGNQGENHVEAGDNHSGQSVPITTLPAFLREHHIARIDALKIDVEGHELDVLEPLFNEAHRESWPRLVICEDVHDGDDRLARLLTAHGYTLARRGRLNGIYRLS
ncbi:MAG: FkbM family methyltransferase [Verrucomicrobiota bacterium]